MEEDRESGPSYKSLFLGCCFIIGGTFGWWLTNFVSNFEGLQKDVSKLETGVNSRFSTLEERVSKLEWEHQHHREKVKGDHTP